ncbi:MAG: TetR/AcrR family transcriptional regulator [Mycobacteriaceae bacterium]|nr:TetR/AcrR family transcriptional regulator [Mycobacteriaceae bacterium]
MPRQSPSLDAATPERIAETALRIIEDEGPQALSFRSVAAQLDIAHASLQRRCRDFTGLIDMCMDHLAMQLPEVAPDTPWAVATETRFRAMYRLLVDHAGLASLRGARPWLGRNLLTRLVEPQLAANIAAGMTPAEAISTYRQMTLLTLGCTGFVDFNDPRNTQLSTRTALAALDPQEYPVLTGNLDIITTLVVDHDVYYTALRRLIAGADPGAAHLRNNP